MYVCIHKYTQLSLSIYIYIYIIFVLSIYVYYIYIYIYIDLIGLVRQFVHQHVHIGHRLAILVISSSSSSMITILIIIIIISSSSRNRFGRRAFTTLRVWQACPHVPRRDMYACGLQHYKHAIWYLATCLPAYMHECAHEGWVDPRHKYTAKIHTVDFRNFIVFSTE